MNLAQAYRLAVVAACLSYASVRDVKDRAVGDLVWLAMAMAVAPAVAYEAHLGELPLTLVASSLSSCLLLGFIAYRLGLFGGADMMALWALGLALPDYPSSSWFPLLGVAQPILSLGVFNNTVALAASTAIYILLRNLAYKAGGRALFEGVEASSAVKALALLTGFKVRASRLDERSHVFILEEVEVGRRRLKVSFPARRAERQRLGVGAEERRQLGEEVWVTPALPLIAYMLAGLAVALILGDLITSLIRWVFSLRVP